MKTNPSLTIGIPAHNEEANIKALLLQLLRQKQTNFHLEKIIVICDGCSDSTEAIVRDLQKTYPIIEVVNDGKKLGKVSRLNELYARNTSDLLFTIDGDVMPERDFELMLLVENFSDARVQIVSAHQEPVKPKHFVGNAIYYMFQLWNEIRKNIEGGDHIANMYGSATMLRKAFAKTVIYPANITADCDYLYIMAKRVNGFTYDKRTRIMYRTAATIREMRLQGTRFMTEREALVSAFGDEVLTMHHIPLKYKLKGLVTMFCKHPVYMLAAIGILISFRLVPERDSLQNSGMWQTASSTKSSLGVLSLFYFLQDLIFLEELPFLELL